MCGHLVQLFFMEVLKSAGCCRDKNIIFLCDIMKYSCVHQLHGSRVAGALQPLPAAAAFFQHKVTICLAVAKIVASGR